MPFVNKQRYYVTKRDTCEAVCPQERNTMIGLINSGIRPNSFANETNKERGWSVGNQYHPESKYPKRIYLLGKGTPVELHIKYNEEYPDDPMPYNHKEAGQLNKEKRHVFTNYIRELVKQGIYKNLNQ